MLYHEQSEDYRPLFWVSGRPIYVNTLLLILHVLAFAITALAVSFDAGVLSALWLGNYESRSIAAKSGGWFRTLSFLQTPRLCSFSPWAFSFILDDRLSNCRAKDLH